MVLVEAAASAIFKIIFQKLANKGFKKYSRSVGIHSQLKELENTLYQIQALLNDASHREVTEEFVGIWLNSLQQLAYDIDDVLDDVATEVIQDKLAQESGEITRKVRKLIPTLCTKVKPRHRLSPKLDAITIKLQELENQNDRLGLIRRDETQESTNRTYETSLLESPIVGREDEKERLILQLLEDESSNKNFSILPIVGMGGIGKTTLARLLYNDSRVNERFELKAWVYVSRDFDTFKISETIFQSVTEEEMRFKDLNLLQTTLKERLRDKRCLLVLDDLWNQNYSDWEKLVSPFHEVAAGSKIIVTTRNRELGTRLSSNHLALLESLSNRNALSLFALHAGIDNFDSHLPLRPKAIGIVEKCGGLPLALKAIGGLLRTKEDVEWDNVLNSEIWALENSNEIIPALRLSYLELSTDLKWLFAYCSLFPKGFLFDKEKLVLLWMAEGYLNQSTANNSHERMGHEYFEKLLSRSFFQRAPNDESLFVMHDLMNDLATFVSRYCFLRFDKHVEMADDTMTKYRHMSFIREEYAAYQKFEVVNGATNLRTLLAVSVGVDQSWNNFYMSSKILVDLLHALPLLRVLSLSRLRISEVPTFIGNLKHLRYLNLSHTEIVDVPESVGHLYNLETLLVSCCMNLAKLPKSFLKLQKLRHFDIRNTPLLKKFPLGIGKLKSLQTLTKVIIGGGDGFAISELKDLENLHGKISIEGLQNVQNPMHAREANLALKKFTELELKWGYINGYSQHATHQMEVLQELKPNTDKLKKLKIVSYEGSEFPNWVGNPTFTQLVHVSIRGCRNCLDIPRLGQLPSLKELFLQGMYQGRTTDYPLEGATHIVYRSLKILWLQDMEHFYLERFLFPCLEELHIDNCLFVSCPLSVEAVPLLTIVKLHQTDCSTLQALVEVGSAITKLEISSILALHGGRWRQIMKYLGAVEELKISLCHEIRYLWHSDAEASRFLVKLRKLYVYRCSNLLKLGDTNEDDNFDNNSFPSLRKLAISACDRMEHCRPPESIESLSLSGCSSLTSVTFHKSLKEQKLKSLMIQDCPNLPIYDNASTSTLEVGYPRGLYNPRAFIKLSNFIHLTQLNIVKCEKMVSFPGLQLPNLTHLEITDCQSMKEFNASHLSTNTSLIDLKITNCLSIDDFFPPRGRWPPNLCNLKIGRLKQPISDWAPQNFPVSLVRLTLYGEYVRDFRLLSRLLPSSLTQLGIEEFEELNTLSFGLEGLTSLQHLIIDKCPNLIDLPEELLPTLLRLGVFECPKLKERCNGRDSDYWPHIFHIPRIEIRDQRPPQIEL